jgi:hypothetical protein
MPGNYIGRTSRVRHLDELVYRFRYILQRLGDAIQTAVDNLIIILSCDRSGNQCQRQGISGEKMELRQDWRVNRNRRELAWVSEVNSDFLVPGEGVQLAETHLWSHPQSGSMSTALVAELAGVLLYCERLISTHNAPISNGSARIGPSRYSTPRWSTLSNGLVICG